MPHGKTVRPSCDRIWNAEHLRLGAVSEQAPRWTATQVPRSGEQLSGRVLACGSPRALLPAAFLLGPCTRSHFLLPAPGVEFEEAREGLGLDLVGPAVAPGLLLVAPLLLVHLVVKEEVAVGRDVGPAVGFEDGPIHGRVQLAEPEDVGVGLVRVVEAV